jgi:predicted lipoprotein with Yx(FWY)xxD motif
MRRSPAIAVVAALLVAATACGNDRKETPSGDGSTALRPRSSASASPVIRTVTVPGLGRVLANDEGFVLYMFPPDKQAKVTCTGPCAGTWPPALAPAGAKPRAAGGVRTALLGTVAQPGSDARVITYNRWPLYTYVADLKPRTALGQALDLNGGYWYVLRSSGEIVRTAATPAGR